LMKMAASLIENATKGRMARRGCQEGSGKIQIYFLTIPTAGPIQIAMQDQRNATKQWQASIHKKAQARASRKGKRYEQKKANIASMK
jgi:hypothetical protein